MLYYNEAATHIQTGGQSNLTKTASKPIPLGVGDKDTHLIQCFLGPRSLHLKKTSVHSIVFAQPTCVTDGLTEARIMNRNSLQQSCIRCSLTNETNLKINAVSHLVSVNTFCHLVPLSLRNQQPSERQSRHLPTTEGFCQSQSQSH